MAAGAPDDPVRRRRARGRAFRGGAGLGGRPCPGHARAGRALAGRGGSEHLRPADSHPLGSGPRRGHHPLHPGELPLRGARLRLAPDRTSDGDHRCGAFHGRRPAGRSAGHPVARPRAAHRAGRGSARPSRESRAHRRRRPDARPRGAPRSGTRPRRGERIRVPDVAQHAGHPLAGHSGGRRTRRRPREDRRRNHRSPRWR